MTRKSRYRKMWEQGSTDPQSLLSMAHKYIQTLHNKNYTQMTINGNEQGLISFLGWCADRAVCALNEVTPSLISSYQSFLHHRTYRDKPLSQSTIAHYLGVICRFFRWLAANHYILYNPAAEIEIPNPGRSRPRDVLTQEEAESIINQPDISTPQGIRDRTILEMFYASGIRLGEMVHLDVDDVSLQRGTIMIRQGKGRRNRVVPLGARAAKWLEKYITQVRCHQAHDLKENALFLTFRGNRCLSKICIAFWVNQYIKSAQVDKSGRCHLFRHTMATLMLENGADVRCIQQMLGHAQLSTTEIYTRVNIRQLKQVHLRTHPADRGESDE